MNTNNEAKNPNLGYEERKKLEEESRQRYIDKTSFIFSKIGRIPDAQRVQDIDIASLEDTLESFNKRYTLDFNPDFQRGHVWTREQQVKFIETLIVGGVGSAGLTISLNCPTYQRDQISEDCDLEGMVIIDGLQRTTAILKFLHNEFKVFEKELGGVHWGYFNGSRYSLLSNTMKIQIFNMQTRKELLDYYLKFNDGGTIHSREEIERVRKLYQEA